MQPISRHHPRRIDPMSDIFLSYAHEDKARVEPFVRLFEKQGWSVWWDPKIAVGASFPDAVEKAIAEASCVVVIWTAMSVARDWVKNEAREGAQRKVLAPVLLDRVPIPLEFRGIEAALLSQWDGLATHPELDLLLSSIAAILQRPITSPTSPPSVWRRARAWRIAAASTGVVSLVVAAVVLQPPEYFFLENRLTGKCLHQHGATTGNGDPITQWECTDLPNVRIAKVSATTDGYFFLRFQHSGKCVHQHGWITGNGAPITQWDCVNQPNLQLKEVPAGNGYVQLHCCPN
jgi:hypothetical protein